MYKAFKVFKPPKKKKKRKRVHPIQEDSSSEEYLLTVSAESLGSVNSQKLYGKTVANGHVIQFQMDSGATVNVLPAREYKKLCDNPEFKELKASEAILSIYNGTGICTHEKRRIRLRNPKNNRKYNLECQIVSEENEPLLGASAIQGMELITVNMQNIPTVDGFAGGETQGLTVSQVVT